MFLHMKDTSAQVKTEFIARLMARMEFAQNNITYCHKERVRLVKVDISIVPLCSSCAS